MFSPFGRGFAPCRPDPESLHKSLAPNEPLSVMESFPSTYGATTPGDVWGGTNTNLSSAPVYGATTPILGQSSTTDHLSSAPDSGATTPKTVGYQGRYYLSSAPVYGATTPSLP